MTAVAVAVAGMLLSTGQNVRSADKTPVTSVASQPAPVAAQVTPATGRAIAYADLNTDQPHYDESSAGMLVGRRR